MPQRNPGGFDPLLALERYRTLVEGSLQGIVIHDGRRILFANRAMAEMLGYSVDELVALPPEGVAALVHPEDRREVFDRIALRMAGTLAPRHTQFRVVRRDGSALWIDVLVHAIEYEGRPAILATSADGTQLRQTSVALQVIARGVASATGEDALRALARHLADVAGASHALVGELLPGGERAVRSVAAVADGHHVPSFACTLAFEPFLDPDHPEPFGHEEGARLFAPGDPGQAEQCMRYWVASALEDQAGIPIGILAVGDREPLVHPQMVRSLLDAVGGRAAAELVRMKSEAALQRALGWRDAIVEGAPDAIFISDATGRFVNVNAAACALTGHTRRELLAMRIPDLHEPEDRRAYRRFHGRIMRGTDAVTTASIRRSDGRKVTVEFNNRRISVEGAPYMLTLARDVTERVKAEEEIRRGRQRLHALTRGLLAAQERERTRLAMELHDQVGQDLTAIKLVLNGARATASQAVLRELQSAADLLDGVLANVRTLSFELRPSTLDELGLTAALRGYVTRHAGATGLELKLSLDDRLRAIPPDVETACFRIAQEAVTNVLRHADARHLGVRLCSRPGGLELVVDDDGVGFPNGARADAELLGLGIAGMHERAALVGGRLTLKPRARGGTRLRAFFPDAPTARDGAA